MAAALCCATRGEGAAAGARAWVEAHRGEARQQGRARRGRGGGGTRHASRAGGGHDQKEARVETGRAGGVAGFGAWWGSASSKGACGRGVHEGALDGFYRDARPGHACVARRSRRRQRRAAPELG
jgi:hypothetical protein